VRRAGFTLLEVAIALAILGVGVVTCLQLFSGSLRLQGRASRETRAVLAARANMDALLFQSEVKNRDNDLPVSAEGFKVHVLVRDATAEDGFILPDAENFEPDFILKYLQVDVAWQDGAGVKTYTVRSMRIAPTDDFF
jgi:prepilin-type N-terminal cleavage/methylation domain-containing protein